MVKLINQQFQLTLTPEDGLQCHLLHVPSGTVLANGSYSYLFGKPAFTDVTCTAGAVVLNGETGTRSPSSSHREAGARRHQ